MRKLITTIALVAILALTGCGPFEQSARDTLAAAGGAIQAAQVEYKQQCTVLASSPACVLINQAVYAQNLAITGLEVYCGFQPNVTLPSTTCVPQKSALGAAQTALANLKQLTGELTALLAKSKPATSAKLRLDQVPTYGQMEAARIALSCDFMPCTNTGSAVLFSIVTRGGIQ